MGLPLLLVSVGARLYLPTTIATSVNIVERGSIVSCASQMAPEMVIKLEDAKNIAKSLSMSLSLSLSLSLSWTAKKTKITAQKKYALIARNFGGCCKTELLR